MKDRERREGKTEGNEKGNVKRIYERRNTLERSQKGKKERDTKRKEINKKRAKERVK